MAMASINIPAMGNLASALDSAAAELPYDQYGFRSILTGVDVDAGPASGLGRVAAWVESQIPGVKRRLALAQAIEAAKPGFQDTVSIDESQLSDLDPAVAQRLGATDAQKLKDADGKLDPELIAEIAKYQNDPYFAAGLAKALSPSDLARIVRLASNSREGQVVPGTKDYDAWFKQYKGLVSALGTTVGTATRATGDIALPPDYAQRWADALTADVGDKDMNYSDAAALSSLLKFGQYSTPFLDKVSSTVYDYERAHEDDHPWSTKAGPTMSRIIDPTGNGLQENIDVLANVLTALGNNPVAAQHFFDVGNPNAATREIEVNGLKVRVDERLAYLLTDRTWNAMVPSDEGKGLGQALEAATTYFRNREGTGKISAQIASQTFALLGTKIGSGSDNLGFGHTWDIWQDLRPSVARMVASYVPDLYRMVGIHDVHGDPIGGDWAVFGDIPGFPPDTPWGAQMDPELMKKILGTLGQDKSNIQIVTAGAAAAQNQLMAWALKKSIQDDPNVPTLIIEGTAVPLLENSSALSASTLGWIVYNAYEGDKADEEAAKKRAELMSQTLSMVASLPIIPAPTGKWSEFIFDQVKDKAIEQIGEGPDGDSSAVYGQMDDDSKQALRAAVMNQLARAGYLDPEYYQRANHDHGNVYVAPPATAFKGHSEHGHWVVDQPPEINFDSDDYTNWVRSYGPNSWLTTNVFSPYDNEFPNIR